MSNIKPGSSIVIISGTSNTIMYINSPLIGLQLVNIPYTFTVISHSNSQLFGYTNGKLYYTTDYTLSNYVPIPLPTNYIVNSNCVLSFDGYNNIIILSDGTNMWYSNTNIRTTINWTPNWIRMLGIESGIMSISLSNKKICYSTSTSNVYYNPDYTSSNWQNINVKNNFFLNISFDGYYMIFMGLSDSSNIYYGDMNYNPTNPNWSIIPQTQTMIDNIYYSNKQACALSVGNIYYNQDAKLPLTPIMSLTSNYSFISFDGYNNLQPPTQAPLPTQPPTQQPTQPPTQPPTTRPPTTQPPTTQPPTTQPPTTQPPTQPLTTQPPIQPPIQESSSSNNMLVIVGVTILVLGIGATLYYFNYAKNVKSIIRKGGTSFVDIGE